MAMSPYSIILIMKTIKPKIFFPEKLHDNVVILFFGIGVSKNGIPEYRLKPWENMFNENGYDVVYFNVRDYVNKCEDRDQFMRPSDLFKMAEKVYDQVLKKGYESVSLNAWSYGCASAIHLIKKRGSKFKFISLMLPYYTIDVNWHYGGGVTKLWKNKNKNTHYLTNMQKKYDLLDKQKSDIIKSYEGPIFVFLAKDDQSWVEGNSAFLYKREQTEKIWIKNANHALSVPKARSDINIQKENEKIWNDFLYEYDLLLKKI